MGRRHGIGTWAANPFFSLEKAENRTIIEKRHEK
jgi:hypothetical protein